MLTKLLQIAQSAHSRIIPKTVFMLGLLNRLMR